MCAFSFLVLSVFLICSLRLGCSKLTWQRCLKRTPANVCPFTKNELRPRQLIVLTHDNVDQYRSQMVGLSFKRYEYCAVAAAAAAEAVVWQQCPEARRWPPAEMRHAAGDLVPPWAAPQRRQPLRPLRWGPAAAERPHRLLPAPAPAPWAETCVR
mmetsp:Transcript_10789/g.33093  ORF Transcript_10789/g.33093 Transcript_10789/m.33093 type:complete len:155 (+) Transcript_10789:58-522(+)